jgi:L-ribulose-5-phosphate 4-epimerase
MTEDNAAIVWLALQIGTPIPIAPDDIAKLHHRYTHIYGQRDAGSQEEGKAL